MSPNVVKTANVRTILKLQSRGWHPCSVVGCSVLWRKGGVLTPAPRCPKHYHRARRDSALADSATDLEPRAKLTFRPTPAGLELVRRMQKDLRQARRPASISDAITALLERTKEG